MTDIKRYEDEIAALQEQVRALAAENSALSRYFSASSVAVNHWNSWADTEDKLALTPETPATDAFISEIRAQGAIDARNALVVAGDGADIYAVVTDVAARIRAGEQP